MDEYAYLEVRTKRELGKIDSLSFTKCFIVIYLHKYVNLLQIIIKNIKMEKVRCVFQISFNYFLVSGIEVIALRQDFPTVDSLETYIYLCHIVEIDSCLLFWVLYNYMCNEYLNCLQP